MISTFFDSLNTGTPEAPVYDRAVDAAIIASMNKLLFTNGVFADPSTNGQVTTGTGMTVTVKALSANLEGYRCIEVNDRTLAVTASHATLDRIDRVVLRLNLNTDYRNIDLYVVAGTPGATPTAPALTRTSSIYELALADLYINALATTISADKITDNRLNSSLCGIVTALPASISTTDIWQTYYDSLQACIDSTLYGKLSGMISLAYNPSSTYALGTYTIHSDVLYRNTTAITVAEAWNAAKWTATTVVAELLLIKAEIAAINNKLVNKTSILASTATLTTSYSNIIASSALTDYKEIEIIVNGGLANTGSPIKVRVDTLNAYTTGVGFPYVAYTGGGTVSGILHLKVSGGYLQGAYTTSAITIPKIYGIK